MRGRTEQLALSEAGRQFAERLLARHPEWEAFVAAYTPVNENDRTEPGSLWLEVPSPHDPAAPLWAIVQDGEALVGLGHRAAEQIFDWEPGERDGAFESILAFIDDVVRAKVVGAWERHRFLWKSWETCHFRRAADVSVGRYGVIRVSAWPTLPSHEGPGA